MSSFRSSRLPSAFPRRKAERSLRVRTQNFVRNRRHYLRSSDEYRASLRAASSPNERPALRRFAFARFRTAPMSFHRTPPRGLAAAAQAVGLEEPVLRLGALAFGVRFPSSGPSKDLTQLVLNIVSPSVLRPCRTHCSLRCARARTPNPCSLRFAALRADGVPDVELRPVGALVSVPCFYGLMDSCQFSCFRRRSRADVVESVMVRRKVRRSGHSLVLTVAAGSDRPIVLGCALFSLKMLRIYVILHSGI